MNLDKVKTGDRLWVMLPGTDNPKTADYDGDDYLLRSKPFEVVFLSIAHHLGDFAECALVDNGRAFTVGNNYLHTTRDMAISQSVGVIEERIESLNIAYEHYMGMLDKPPA